SSFLGLERQQSRVLPDCGDYVVVRGFLHQNGSRTVGAVSPVWRISLPGNEIRATLNPGRCPVGHHFLRGTAMGAPVRRRPVSWFTRAALVVLVAASGLAVYSGVGTASVHAHGVEGLD